MKKRSLTLALALALGPGYLVPGSALADGEPTAYLSDTGVIVPVDEAKASVLYQKVTVTMPRPERWPKPAQIRADYVLRNRSGRPGG